MKNMIPYHDNCSSECESNKKCDSPSQRNLIIPTDRLLASLEPQVLHIWSATLDVPDDILTNLHGLLAKDELARAERLRSYQIKKRFIVARGFLRQILARYIDSRPQEINFAFNSNGKPSLSHQPPGLDIRFNLSHSADRALYAITSGQEVGIDIEKIRPDFPCSRLARRFFSLHETEELLNLPEELQTEAFFRCWTRKEAYLKGCGQGLTLPLDSFSVSLLPGEPAALLSHNGNPGEVHRWHMAEILLPSGFCGAIACECPWIDSYFADWSFSHAKTAI